MASEIKQDTVAASTATPTATSSTSPKPTTMTAAHHEVEEAVATTNQSSLSQHPTRASTSSDVSQTPHGPVRTDTTTALAQALAANSSPSPPIVPVQPSGRTRAQSTAIGPSTEQADPITKEQDQSSPQLELTLLLTNGARHPFIIDANYLAKRNVEVQAEDPYNLSVYKLKELILREWREEWEQKPTSPSYIRLISFGKLLDDKSAIKDLRFNRTERNVVHMTIKPQDFVDDDDNKGGKAAFSAGRSGSESRSPGCRCVIM